MENLIFHMGFTDRGMVWNTIRSLFAWFDSIIYTILGWFFQTIFYIANFQMNILYEEMQTRVYVILGIFMLFKLVISFLSYLVNPDKISDKEQGIGKVVTRVILVLIMFLALPTFFNIMTELQNRLLPVIPRIIIGQTAGGDFFDDDSETGNTTIDVSGMGQTMALSVYRAFLRTNTACTTLEEESNDPTVSLWSSMDDATEQINDPCPNNDDIYKYTYTPIVPFIVGIIMVVVVLGINLDIGIRSFKLLILRAIAPIPILSYIDPKSSKDGAFSKWTKMLFSTWISLFINLGIVYLVIYLIQMLFRADVWANFFGNFTSPNPVINAIVLILVVIALLFFAREAPQFIMDALGIKSTGSFGKMLGMATSALGMAGSARASYQASRDADEALGKGHGFLNTAKNMGAGLFGGISGGMAGAHAALNAKDNHMQASRDAISKRNATALSRGAAGSTFGGRIISGMEGFFQGENSYQRMDREIKDLEQSASDIKSFQDNIKSEAIKGKYGAVSVSGNYIGDNNVTGKSKSLRAQAQVAIANGESMFYYSDEETGNTFRISTTDYERVAGDMEKAEMQLLSNLLETDATVRADNPELVAQREAVFKDAEKRGVVVRDTTSGMKNLDANSKVLRQEAINMKNSNEYRQGKVNAEANRR